MISDSAHKYQKRQMIETYVEEKDLKLFPEVNWDRFGRDYAFGWIPREDGKFDFMCITYHLIDQENVKVMFTCSSARYSAEFAKRLGSTDHEDCKRIEHYFDIKNCIKLERGQNEN